MSDEVHGHEILERILAAGGTLGIGALRDFAIQTHGENARYFTCSANGMSFDELMTFLAQRRKVVLEGDLVTVFAENLCNHQQEAGGHSHPH